MVPKLPNAVRWAFVAVYILVAMLLALLSGCDRQDGRKLTVIDSPVAEESGALTLERIDRIEGLLAFDWIAEDALLAKTSTSSNSPLVIHHLQSSQSDPTNLLVETAADVSPDQRHVLLLDTLQANLAVLETKQILPLRMGNDQVSWILRDAHGSWADEQTYVLPVVRGKDAYGVVLVKTDGTVTTLSMPNVQRPIYKVVLHQDRLYFLDMDQKLRMYDRKSQSTSVLREHVADFALSPDSNTLAIAVHTSLDEITLFMADASGQSKGTIVAKGRLLQQLSWSKDSRKLAFTVFSLGQGMNGLFVMDAETGSTLPLSTHPNLESPIVWSPTSRQLFVSESDRYSRDGSAHTTIFRLTP